MPSVLDSDSPLQPIPNKGSAAMPLPSASIVKKPMPDMPGMEPEMRSFMDIDKTRQSIYDGVLNAAREMPEFTNNKYKLKLVDVNYADSAFGS
jgi:hypothetical protein